MILTLLNPETTDLEKSYLSNAYSVGATSIVVKNSNRFIINDRIMIGEMGSEKTEVVTVSAVSADGMTLTVGATLFSHESGSPVYQLRFDSARFYRATSLAGAYTLISTQSMDVDNANLSTLYDDTAGVTSNYYKMTAYHSISGLESAFSDIIGGGGWRREQVGNIIDEVLAEVSDLGEEHMTRSEMLGYFNDVNDDLKLDKTKPYDFLHTRMSLSRTIGLSYIDFPTDTNGKQLMWKFDRMDYNFKDPTTTPVTDDTYTLNVLPAAYFRNKYGDNTIDVTTESDFITEMTLDTSVDRFRFNCPALTSATNVLFLHYWSNFTDITSEGDIIQTPTPKIYKMYIKSVYYAKRAVTEFAHIQSQQLWDGKYQQEKARYKATNRKDAGTPRSMRPENHTTRSYRRP